jgi:hypothetical protein
MDLMSALWRVSLTLALNRSHLASIVFMCSLQVIFLSNITPRFLHCDEAGTERNCGTDGDKRLCHKSILLEVSITPMCNNEWRKSEINFVPTASTICGVKTEYTGFKRIKTYKESVTLFLCLLLDLISNVIVDIRLPYDRCCRHVGLILTFHKYPAWSYAHIHEAARLEVWLFHYYSFCHI